MNADAQRLQAVGLDLDGTLVDTMADLTAATNKTLAEFGLRQLPPEVVRGYVGHGVERLVRRALSGALQKLEPEPALLAAALKVFREKYRADVFVASRIYPGIPELLAWLKREDIPVCCITNKESALTLPLLEQSGLAASLDLVLCADTPQKRKPEPAMLKEACEHFGVEPATFLYIGDSEVDAAASAAAGCGFLGVRYGYGLISGAASLGFVERADQLLDVLQRSLSALDPAGQRLPRNSLI